MEPGSKTIVLILDARFLIATADSEGQANAAEERFMASAQVAC
jgi:hypothetical protein